MLNKAQLTPLFSKVHNIGFRRNFKPVASKFNEDRLELARVALEINRGLQFETFKARDDFLF